MVCPRYRTIRVQLNSSTGSFLESTGGAEGMRGIPEVSGSAANAQLWAKSAKIKQAAVFGRNRAITSSIIHITPGLRYTWVVVSSLSSFLNQLQSRYHAS